MDLIIKEISKESADCRVEDHICGSQEFLWWSSWFFDILGKEPEV